MKETSFINQNKKKWARFEKLRNSKSNDPDEVSELFTEITEDLSYARTFYPRRSVRVYLNQLAQGVFTSLYKQRRQPLGSFTKFWTETVPLEVYRSRVNLLVAFCVFALAAIVGAASQAFDPDFARIILGDSYVDQTEARIAAGNPMGIYGESSQTSMFLQITFNNIRVAFFAFVGGILFNLITLYLLINNGIMLGSFQWWFKTKGLLLTSFLTIWIHGAFEISAIVVAGAAGLTVGNGIFFPKSYSRLQSLIFAGKRGLTIMLSLVPFFIIAGFLESFVTRYYLSLHDLVKWGIILFSFGIFIAYYVVYPFIVAKKYPDKIPLKEVPRYIPKRVIEAHKLRSVGEIFTDTFYSFVNHFRFVFFRIAIWAIPIMIIMMIIVFAFDWHRFNYLNLTWWETFGTLFGTGKDFNFYKIFGWAIPLSIIALMSVYSTFKEQLNYTFGQLAVLFISVFVFTSIVLLGLTTLHGGFLFLLIAAVPILALIPPIIVLERKNFFQAFGKSFSLVKNSYGDGIGTFAVFALIAVIFFWILENPFFDFGLIALLEMITKMFTITVFDDYAVIISIVKTLLYLLYLAFMIMLYGQSLTFYYYNSIEKNTAKGLYNRLEKFGQRSRTLEKDLDFE